MKNTVGELVQVATLRNERSSTGPRSTSTNLQRLSKRLLIGGFAMSIVLVSILTFAGSGVKALASSPPGCGPDSPGSTTLTLRVDGYTRVVIVHVPSGSTNLMPMALILNLHGSTGSAATQVAFTNMDATANANRFIVAYPQAYIAAGSGFQWNNPPLYGGAAVPPNSPNDAKFLVTLVKILQRDYCINPREVYATGHSGGAREVSLLGCVASKVFAAIAPVDGVRRPLPCNSLRAVSIIAFHGSADPVNPWNGNGQPYWTYSVLTAMRLWGQQDHCSHSSTSSRGDSTVVLVRYFGCANGAVAELYEVIGEGHDWPGGPTAPPIPVQGGFKVISINANQLMWSFFKAHRLG